MPTWFSDYRRRPPSCERPFKWSWHRGGCRFNRGHKGPCKPGRYKASVCR